MNRQEQLQIFFKRYYHDAIIDLAERYPEQKNLSINYHDLERFDLDYAMNLIDKPDEVLSEISDALKDYDSLPDDIDMKAILICIKNLPETEKISIHKIGSDQINKLVSVGGVINKIAPIKSKLSTGAFKCQRCDDVSYIQQEGDKLTEPFECFNEACRRKGPFTLVHDKSTWIDEQKIEIQELYENLRPGQPIREMIVILSGRDLINALPAIGSQVIISGIPRTQKKENSSLFNIIMDAVHIESIDTDITITLSESDKKELKEIAANNNILDMLAQSTAPTVLGYHDIKLALLSAIVSGPNYMLQDGRTLRGYIHVAICGDPGTAKTVMVVSTQSLVQRSQYAAGKGASGAGLTVSVIKDELSGSGYTAQAGALVLADKGLLVIDELDKLEPEDIQRMNTALELGRFSINKGGLNQWFNSRCPVIAISNPKNIRFDDHEAYAKQIDIPSDTLSRFDLVFLIQDQPDPDKDRAIAEHQGQLWKQTNSASTNNNIPISSETMRKYLAYAKTFEPVITDDVSKVITEYYLELRKVGTGAIAITARDNNALYRLARSISKLRLSNECTLLDAQKAIEIHRSAQKIITDPTTGKLDSDLLYGMGKSQRDRIKIIKELTRELQNSNGKSAFFDDIVSSAKAEGIHRDAIIDTLRHLKTKGDIIEMSEGMYQVIS